MIYINRFIAGPTLSLVECLVLHPKILNIDVQCICFTVQTASPNKYDTNMFVLQYIKYLSCHCCVPGKLSPYVAVTLKRLVVQPFCFLLHVFAGRPPCMPTLADIMLIIGRSCGKPVLIGPDKAMEEDRRNTNSLYYNI